MYGFQGEPGLNGIDGNPGPPGLEGSPGLPGKQVIFYEMIFKRKYRNKLYGYIFELLYYEI